MDDPECAVTATRGDCPRQGNIAKLSGDPRACGGRECRKLQMTCRVRALVNTLGLLGSVVATKLAA